MTDNNHKQRILRERAKRLKKPIDTKDEQGDFIKGLEFLLAGERYVINSVYVNEVIHLKDLTKLPCTPSFIMGIINLRGKILSVVDIKKFLNLPATGISDLNRVIIVQYKDIELGILADTVLGNPNIYKKQLKKNLRNVPHLQDDFIVGVNSGKEILLDIKALLASDKLIVNEEV